MWQGIGHVTMARGIWQGEGWEYVAGAGDMWQGVVAGGGGMWQGLGAYSRGRHGDMWQVLGTCGRVWAHVTGVMTYGRVWSHLAGGGGIWH